VVWPCLINRLPFEVALTVPGGKGKSSTTDPGFKLKFPLGTVPAVEDPASDVRLGESPAILAYLAGKHGWKDVYPADQVARAKIDEYTAWHHSGTRSVAKGYFAPSVRPDLVHDEESVAAAQELAMRSLSLIDSHFLEKGPFIAGLGQPSAADFLCYSEVAQIGPRFGNLVSFDSFPNLERWQNTMAALPFHDAVFAAVEGLGDLRPGHGDVPVLKRLGPATKKGLMAIKAAQEA